MMPSLIKYFATVGTLLALGLIGLNAVIAPGGPGPSLVKEPAKAIVVKHDPSASLVERLRDDEAARKARRAAPQSRRPPLSKPLRRRNRSRPHRPCPCSLPPSPLHKGHLR